MNKIAVRSALGESDEGAGHGGARLIEWSDWAEVARPKKPAKRRA
jgi:hypothetical protein